MNDTAALQVSNMRLLGSLSDKYAPPLLHLLSGMLWHADSTFLPEKVRPITLSYGVIGIRENFAWPISPHDSVKQPIHLAKKATELGVAIHAFEVDAYDGSDGAGEIKFKVAARSWGGLLNFHRWQQNKVSIQKWVAEFHRGSQLSAHKLRRKINFYATVQEDDCLESSQAAIALAA